MPTPLCSFGRIRPRISLAVSRAFICDHPRSAARLLSTWVIPTHLATCCRRESAKTKREVELLKVVRVQGDGRCMFRALVRTGSAVASPGGQCPAWAC